MIGHHRLGAPATGLALFVALAGIPLVALGWLGWRLLDQDRALESQRLRERLENVATLAARELDRSLGTWGALLAPAARGDRVVVPPGAVLVVFDGNAVVRHQGVALPYYPGVPPAPEPLAAAFADAETVELRDRNLSQAAGAYRAFAASPHSGVRAAALVRLARVLRKQTREEEALAVYGQLVALGDASVAGAPAALVGLRERSALLKAAGRDAEAAEEAARLAEALRDGRFRLDRATFDFYREPFGTGPTEQGSAGVIALAEAADASWALWLREPAGRSSWSNGAGAFATVWQRSPDGAAAIVGRVEDLVASTRPVVENWQARLTLEDQSRHIAWGQAVPDTERVTKTSVETGLPWTLHVAVADPAAVQAMSASRRNVFAAGFGLMLLVIAAAGYFVFRAVHRELGVARLQSDFVAAVSHEFRSPLTAMCHLTEMLEEGGTPPERLTDYYRALGRESRRLHAMVENLLDFGRLDAGRRAYQFVDTDAAELVNRVVQECRDQTPSTAHRVECLAHGDAQPARMRIRADREALALALRNLVDNAVKSSPESSTVRVSVTPRGAFVGIAVEDEGPGIPKDEQRTIFQKFARGSAARTLNVKGTGIGLTMADQIVRAHGGRLELDSEPGRGTRFTTLLPAAAGHA